jgi:hypothetical protein
VWDEFPQPIDRIDELQHEVMRLAEVEAEARLRGDRSHEALCRRWTQAPADQCDARRALPGPVRAAVAGRSGDLTPRELGLGSGSSSPGCR